MEEINKIKLKNNHIVFMYISAVNFDISLKDPYGIFIFAFYNSLQCSFG